MRENAQPPDPLATATSLSGLAGLYQVARRAAEAEPLLKRALEIEEKMLPEGHPRLAINLGDLATAYRTQGKLVEAEPLAKRALASFEKSLPVGHFRIAWTLNELAALSYAKGAWADATNYSRRASTIIIERSKRAAQSAEGGATDTARSELSQNTGAFEWLMLSAWSLAEQQPDQRGAWARVDRRAMGDRLRRGSTRPDGGAFRKGEGDCRLRTQQNSSGQWRNRQANLSRRALCHRTAQCCLKPRSPPAWPIPNVSSSHSTRGTKEFPGYAALSTRTARNQRHSEQLRSDEALIQFAFAEPGLRLATSDKAMGTTAAQWPTSARAYSYCAAVSTTTASGYGHLTSSVHLRENQRALNSGPTA